MLKLNVSVAHVPDFGSAFQAPGGPGFPGYQREGSAHRGGKCLWVTLVHSRRFGGAEFALDKIQCFGRRVSWDFVIL